MAEDIRIDKLDEEGKHLFVYTDRYYVYFVFYSLVRKKLFNIRTDKYLTILLIDEVNTPEGRDFSEFTDIKFFKPYTRDGEHFYIGIVSFKDETLKFTIKYNDLQYEEKAQYQPSSTFNAVECLKDSHITSYIQKRNRLYVVGCENGEIETNSMFGVVDLENDKFESIYYLFSDNGEIQLTAINIDTDDLKVYVVGSLKSHEAGSEVPYLETFLLRSHP